VGWGRGRVLYLLGVDGAETGSLPESEPESESRWSKRAYDAHVGPVLSGCMGMVMTAARLCEWHKG
jgi:hypothetical protein